MCRHVLSVAAVNNKWIWHQSMDFTHDNNKSWCQNKVFYYYSFILASNDNLDHFEYKSVSLGTIIIFFYSTNDSMFALTFVILDVYIHFIRFILPFVFGDDENWISFNACIFDEFVCIMNRIDIRGHQTRSCDSWYSVWRLKACASKEILRNHNKMLSKIVLREHSIRTFAYIYIK